MLTKDIYIETGHLVWKHGENRLPSDNFKVTQCVRWSSLGWRMATCARWNLSGMPGQPCCFCWCQLRGGSRRGEWRMRGDPIKLCVQIHRLTFFFFLIYLFIYLFLAVLGLRFCARAVSSCCEWGPLFIAVRGPLTVAASLVAEHRLQTRRLSNCGSRAQLLRGMWDLPRPGLEPMSPALAGRFSTTAPPGKP